MYNRLIYNKSLPNYAGGGWMRRNAGAIGSIVGTGLGVGAAGALDILSVGTATPLTGALIAGGERLGNSIGGSVQSNYEDQLLADQQSESNRIAQFNQNRLNQQQLAIGQFKNNNNQFIGTNNFAGGGILTPKNPTTVGNPKLPNRNIRIDYSRIPQLMQASFIGGSPITPFNDYFSAVDRNLTPITQNFIYNRTGNISPEEASIKETLSGMPHEFYSTNDTGITRLIPTTPVDSDRALRAKQFLSDMYSRGQIKYCHGGGLKKMSNGGLLEYGGPTHENGIYGGIPVDGMGNPSSITGNQTVGLTENGEVSHTFNDGSTYIFSNRLKYE